ncbi:MULTISPECIES: DUF2637 domain-containing protein [unclassified Frankia]|uniref:DUF2637 domain-containing protein n=2 Tax=Frankia TaxID=1854 RepID=UPI001EF6DA5C|nr:MULTISPECIES: DUF2637 domain-containing protein [unclassified Frankia]
MFGSAEDNRPGADTDARAGWTDRAIGAATVAAVVTVAAVAAFVSYRHMRGVALDHGEDATAAAVIPFSVDGLMLAASMTMLADRRAGRSRSWLSYLLLTMGAFASLAANVLHAEPNLTARVIAGWPALALLGSYELLMRQIRVASRTAENRAAGGRTTPAGQPADDTFGVPHQRDAQRGTQRDAQRAVTDLMPLFTSQPTVAHLAGSDPDGEGAGMSGGTIAPSLTLDAADKREAIVHALEQTNGSASEALAFLAARGVTVSKSWVYEVRKDSRYADVYTGPLPIIGERTVVGGLG